MRLREAAFHCSACSMLSFFTEGGTLLKMRTNRCSTGTTDTIDVSQKRVHALAAPHESGLDNHAGPMLLSCNESKGVLSK